MAADSTLLLSLVEEFVSGLQDSKAKETATCVKDGQFTILQLVEALGLSLTSSQPHTRARGVQLLSDVLHDCYGGLTEREVEVLIAFFENRLKDHYVITPPVLQGLRALTKSTVLPPGSAVSMLRSLFQDVHVQVILTKTCVFLFNVSAELKGLGADFVFGFVQSMDGERDPRNLLLAFQIAKSIVRRGYDLGKFTEELFEVTSCYFPIDFSPPPNDPHGITREELIQMLRDALTGTPRFAEFLLPLIIEKLDSDVLSAKLDSLQTLIAGVSQYEHKDVAEFLEGLWASLRREVFQTSSEKIESAGLAALTALTSCLSRSVLHSDSEDSLSTFLDLVLKDCKHHLCEPDLKLVWPSAKLLQAACSASNRASHIITDAVMPSLVEQYNSRAQVKDSVFLAFRPSLCSMVFSALTETDSSLQITATSVLTSLAQQTGLLLDSDVELAVDHLTRLLLTEEDDKVRSALLSSSILPIILCFYFSVYPFFKCTHTNAHYLHRGQVRHVAPPCSYSSPVLSRFLRYLLYILVQMSDCFSLSELVLRCIYLSTIRTFFMGFVRFPLGMFHVVRLAGQTALRAVSLFLDGDVSFLPDNSFPSNIQLLKQGDSWSQSQMVCLLLGCVCSLPRIVNDLMAELEEMSCTCSHPLSYTSAAKCFAGLVNKRALGDCLDSLIQRTMERVCGELDSASSSVRTQAFTLMIWVAKALLLRYHPLFTTLTDKLFSLLDDADLGPAAADGFRLLMSESTDILNRGCHADVRIMYRQRFFSENSAKLVQGFNAAPQEKKPNYLKALSNIVNKLPKQVQVTELPALLSLLLEALSCPDQGVQLSTLSCLEPVLVDPPPALIQQLEALVSRLLALTSSPVMSVRIASLRCIHAISCFPEHEVLPFRTRVLRALARPLDDRKRLVRRGAVRARAEW
uniref:MMS19 nucleotide excision repair protein n=1 Tax=Cyclopterus lumpus TaxID=8103 RepID=A0A8C3AYM8_CYCLU